MTIWYSILVPIAVVVFMYLFYAKEIAWWEYILPIAVTAIFIFGVKTFGEFSMTKDTEYWGGWVVTSTYYEPWDEEVPCRHPIYRTETYTYSCGKNETCTGTREVYVGDEHPYDVDFHPAEYNLIDSNNFELAIDEATWREISEKLHNTQKVDMNRRYHSIDGDSFVASFDGSEDKIVPVTTEHNYENRIINSNSVFNYKPVEGKEREGLYDYVFTDFIHSPSVLPEGTPGSIEISKINAQLGAQKQVRVWVLLFFDKDREIAKRQEALWKNGNMNELVVCVGVDKSYDIKWAEVFSWTKNQDIKVNLKSYLESQKTLNLTEFAPYLKTQIQENWVRRDFAEFNYLQVEQPLWAIITAYILATACSVSCAFFSITNEFTLEHPM